MSNKILGPGSKLLLKDHPHQVWDVINLDEDTGYITIRLINCEQYVLRSYHVDRKFKHLVALNHRFLVDNTIAYIEEKKAKTKNKKNQPKHDSNNSQTPVQLHLPDSAPPFLFGYTEVIKLGLWSTLYNCYTQFVEICDLYNKHKITTKKERNGKLFKIINNTWEKCYLYFYNGDFKLISQNKINKLGYFIYRRGYHNLFNARYDDDLSLDEFLHAFISLIAYHIYHINNTNTDIFYDIATINDINSNIQSAVSGVASMPTIPVIDKPVLHVYDNLFTIRCKIYNHQVSPSTVFVKTTDDEIIELPIHQCNTCGNLYIGRETLRTYISVYGELTNIHIIGDYGAFSNESLLHSLGYNVRKNNGMTKRQRQDLLLELMDNGKITYEAACETIEGNIARFKSISKYNNAVTEWRADLKFMGDDIIKKKYSHLT